MPVPPGAEPPKPLEASTAGILGRIAETSKLIFTVSDQMARLAKEDERSQNQILELTKLVFSLSKDVAGLAGQMQGIEKRLEDREKTMEAMIALRVRDEVERAMRG